jgi:hypothetical protein
MELSNPVIHTLAGYSGALGSIVSPYIRYLETNFHVPFPSPQGTAGTVDKARFLPHPFQLFIH